MASNENLSPAAIRALLKEVKDLTLNPPEGIKMCTEDEDVTEIQAIIEGPAGTPFEGGYFRVTLKLGADFPQSPPKGYFITKIFHPNVSPKGEICVNTLKKDWKPEHGIRHVLLIIKCLLIHPNPESALNEDAGKLLLEAYEDYAKHARLMTSIHAKKQKDTTATSSSAPMTKDATAVKKPTVPAKQTLEKKKSLKRL